jgi:catechol 2,3-dioxygenase-like lactoylglutathione lyase family enzyme
MFDCLMNSTAAPPINGVLETALYVENLARATKFYAEVMGFRLMTGDAVRFQAFDDGGDRVLLLFKRGETLIPTAASGVTIPPHDASGQHMSGSPSLLMHTSLGCDG